MANRVTEDEVKGVLQPGSDDIVLTPFISTAHMIVEEDLVGKGMSAERLRLLELYLAAHFSVITIGELTMKKVGDATDDYVKVRLYDGLRASTFGQQAIALDTSGTLSQMGGTNAVFEVLT
jgi:hypothetical protein